jgi:hypothetical protein
VIRTLARLYKEFGDSVLVAAVEKRFITEDERESIKASA